MWSSGFLVKLKSYIYLTDNEAQKSFAGESTVVIHFKSIKKRVDEADTNIMIISSRVCIAVYLQAPETFLFIRLSCQMLLHE